MEWNYRGSHSRDLFSRLRRKIHVADTPMSDFPALIRSFEVKRSKTRHSLSIKRHSTCVVTTSNEYRYIKSSIFCRFAGKDSRPMRVSDFSSRCYPNLRDRKTCQETWPRSMIFIRDKPRKGNGQREARNTAVATNYSRLHCKLLECVPCRVCVHYLH